MLLDGAGFLTSRTSLALLRTRPALFASSPLICIGYRVQDVPLGDLTLLIWRRDARRDDGMTDIFDSGLSHSHVAAWPRHSLTYVSSVDTS